MSSGFRKCSQENGNKWVWTDVQILLTPSAWDTQLSLLWSPRVEQGSCSLEKRLGLGLQGTELGSPSLTLIPEPAAVMEGSISKPRQVSGGICICCKFLCRSQPRATLFESLTQRAAVQRAELTMLFLLVLLLFFNAKKKLQTVRFAAADPEFFTDPESLPLPT